MTVERAREALEPSAGPPGGRGRPGRKNHETSEFRRSTLRLQQRLQKAWRGAALVTVWMGYPGEHVVPRHDGVSLT
jgi:hypothetical protein